MSGTFGGDDCLVFEGLGARFLGTCFAAGAGARLFVGVAAMTYDRRSASG